MHKINIFLKNGNHISIKVTDIEKIDFSEDNASNGIIKNGDEYVDLGLSVLWAANNVGATKPEEIGDFYSWGEIESKEDYSRKEYKYLRPMTAEERGLFHSKQILPDDYYYCKITKYNTSNSRVDVIDFKKELEIVDDVAFLKCGSKWRIPSDTDYKELINNCVKEWAVVNGVGGYKFTSKVEGFTDRSIFLPAAGYVTDRENIDKKTDGLYWSRTLMDGNGWYAYMLCCTFNQCTICPCERECGLLIRPVRYKESVNK